MRRLFFCLNFNSASEEKLLKTLKIKNINKGIDNYWLVYYNKYNT